MPPSKRGRAAKGRGDGKRGRALHRGRMVGTPSRVAAVALVCALVRPGTSLLVPRAHPGGSQATPSSPARQCVRRSAPAAPSRLRPLVLCAAEDRPLPSISSPEVALVVGSALLLVLVVNRLFTEELLNSQSRADLIATAGATVLLLEALSCVHTCVPNGNRAVRTCHHRACRARLRQAATYRALVAQRHGRHAMHGRRRRALAFGPAGSNPPGYHSSRGRLGAARRWRGRVGGPGAAGTSSLHPRVQQACSPATASLQPLAAASSLQPTCGKPATHLRQTCGEPASSCGRLRSGASWTGLPTR